MGWVIHQIGFRRAFGLTAVVAALALPAFLYAERKLGFSPSSPKAEVKRHAK
jgi:hypothetical protein